MESLSHQRDYQSHHVLLPTKCQHYQKRWSAALIAHHSLDHHSRHHHHQNFRHLIISNIMHRLQIHNLLQVIFVSLRVQDLFEVSVRARVTTDTCKGITSCRSCPIRKSTPCGNLSIKPQSVFPESLSDSTLTSTSGISVCCPKIPWISLWSSVSL